MGGFMIRVGDFVTRKSYGNDIVFKVVGIEGNNCFLYGTCIRLSADSPIQDLVLYDGSIPKTMKDFPGIKLNSFDNGSNFNIPKKLIIEATPKEVNVNDLKY